MVVLGTINATPDHLPLFAEWKINDLRANFFGRLMNFFKLCKHRNLVEMLAGEVVQYNQFRVGFLERYWSRYMEMHCGWSFATRVNPSEMTLSALSAAHSEAAFCTADWYSAVWFTRSKAPLCCLMPEVLETSCPHPDYPSGQLYYVGISTHVVDLRNPILSDPILIHLYHLYKQEML